ncbi:MAG TPA: ribonuclease PH [Myxococcales bacterium LLY-WYZ-16_1]|nr:ribonuclease PH [Myxococcales bacterium LLY-WYZ-16_1]
MSPRADGRAPDQLRTVGFELGYTKWAEGSVLCRFGDTHVLCNATLEARVPPWMNEPGRGWVTAEYAMLPRSTDRRNRRESLQGRVGGRTHEISRLIGRSLRAAVNLQGLGERTITLDCDVLQADGGTRTAAITGGWVALQLAVRKLLKTGELPKNPVHRNVAAVSVGVRGTDVLLDLDYGEDQAVDADVNLVMTDQDEVVEVQGTAEQRTFSRGTLDRVLDVGTAGIQALVRAQREALETVS